MLILAVAQALAAAAPGSRGEPHRANGRRAAPDVAALIDQLPQVSDEVTYYSAASFDRGNPFWPMDHTGLRGDANTVKSTQSPVLRQIVSKGADALPLLLAHLTDARQTKSGIATVNTFARSATSTDYRFLDPKKQPKGVSTREEDTRPQGLGGKLHAPR